MINLGKITWTLKTGGVRGKNKSVIKFRPFGAQILWILSNEQTIFIRQGTLTHFYMGEQSFKRVEEKDKLLKFENLNYHTLKLLAKAGERLGFLTQEKKNKQNLQEGAQVWLVAVN